MKIVLDTNVYRQDFLFRSSDFRLLFDYLQSADSTICLPQVVYQEVESLYVTTLSGAAAAFKSCRKKLLSVVALERVPELAIDVEEEGKRYLEYLRSTLGIAESELTPYRGEYLSDLVERACTRKRPCSDKGEEFRDGILWLTVLDIAAQSDELAAILISSDRKAFADADGGLHKDLIDEAQRRGVEIHFFTSLSDFLRSRAAKVEAITSEWVYDASSVDGIARDLEERIRDYWFEYELKKLIARDRFGVSELDIDIIDMTVGPAEVVDYFVYELGDGSLSIRASLRFDVHVDWDADDEHPVDVMFPPELMYSTALPGPPSSARRFTSRPFTPSTDLSLLASVELLASGTELRNANLLDWHIE
ncbi:MAG TPA: PIN domain-containing protein [Acidobacteriota bacterium]|nr:PIN domain-containing protein [Acidobacteriota bacterium]